MLDKGRIWIARSVGARRLGGLLRLRHGNLDVRELGLTLDGEQGDLAATARPALERPAVDRCPVIKARLQQPEGDGATMAVRADRQERQAASAAGDRTRGIVRHLDHVEHGSRRSTSRPLVTLHRVSAETTDGMASTDQKSQDVVRRRAQADGTAGKRFGARARSWHCHLRNGRHASSIVAFAASIRIDLVARIWLAVRISVRAESATQCDPRYGAWNNNQ
jgi:hypothetical protein